MTANRGQHRLVYAAAERTAGPVNLWWRILALLLDVLLLGPPIALLCVAGAFNSEATHRQPDPAYLVAGGIALCYALAEAAWGVTPGLAIMGARIIASGQRSNAQRRPLRWAMKCGPFLFAYIWSVALGGPSDTTTGVIANSVALSVWACVAVAMLLSLLTHVLSRGRRPLYFDDLAKTRVLFIRGHRSDSAAG